MIAFYRLPSGDELRGTEDLFFDQRGCFLDPPFSFRNENHRVITAMTWQFQYTNSNKLLLTILETSESIGEIRAQHIHTALVKLELNARALSSYASTSIEGNPLPLTDVKRLLKTHKDSIRDTEREVINYNTALQTLYQSIHEDRFTLSIKTVERVQGWVVDGLMDNPPHCGALRKTPLIIRNP